MERVTDLLDLALQRARLRQARESAPDLAEVQCPACGHSLGLAEIRCGDGRGACPTCAGLHAQVIRVHIPDNHREDLGLS